MSAPLDQRPNQPIRAGTRSVTRWEIAADDDYESSRDRFELVVPAMDYEATYRLVADEAPWAGVVEIVERDAPHGFMICWKLDTFPVMRLAGHRTRATEYLMGNHVIAEQMACHDAGRCTARTGRRCGARPFAVRGSLRGSGCTDSGTTSRPC